MNEQKLLTVHIANKIKQLKKEKCLSNGDLSTAIGVGKSYISELLSGKKRFNLIHIEKICAALDYPVAKLFEDDTHPQKEQASPPLGQEETLLEIFRRLSRAHKLDVISFAGGRRLAEAPPPKASKKDIAAALGESGERHLSGGKI